MDAYFPQAYKIGKNFPGHPVRCGKNKFVLSDGERDILKWAKEELSLPVNTHIINHRYEK